MNYADARSRLIRLWSLVLCLLLATPAMSALAAARVVDVDAPSPALDHAQVIAQGVARMPTSPVAWRVTTREAPPAPDALRDADLQLAFILADEAALFLRAGGERYRLAPGEAYLLEAGDEPRLSSLDDDPADFYALELVSRADADDVASGATIIQGGGFDIDGRDYDLDLVRDVLTRDEEAEIDDVDYPVLVLVTDGAVEVRAGRDAPVELAAGEAETFVGNLTLTGVDRRSAVVAAVIGPNVDGVGNAQPRATTPPEPTIVPAATRAPLQPTAPPPPTATPTTVPSGPNDDPDGDGLTNADEDLRGTDRLNPDSDGDGLRDGSEVFDSGTLPLDADSDNDGLSDGLEVSTLNTNPSSNDTDGDGVQDGDEVQLYATDPNLQDSDGDTFTDGQEISAVTDPNDPNSHP